MTPKQAESPSPLPFPSPDEIGLVQALKRPSSLKAWSSQLVDIVKKQENALFDGWDFEKGALTREDFGRVLKKMTGCGSVVELRSALNRNTGEISSPVLHAANFCGQHTICPYCAGRVQDRRGMKYGDAIKGSAVAYRHAYMVTATIPPSPAWRENLSALVASWQNFRKMGQRRGGRKSGRSRGEWGKVRAGLAKIELKRGSGSGLPHCHYHALIFTQEPLDFQVWSPAEKKKPKEARLPLYRIPSESDPRGWIPASKISAEWFQATGGATNFRVDAIRYRDADRTAGRSWDEAVLEQSREVLKYATKFDSSPAAGSEKLFASDFVGIRDATYCRRLFVAYGDFRKIQGSDFVGGGPHISERPLIWESRWRGVEYSPLIERTKAVFVNSDQTLSGQKRITLLNRAQGSGRRIRSAILKSKRAYFQDGVLTPAYYARREWREDGSFTDTPVAMEVPAYVAANPANPATWETWMDVAMQAARDHYAEVREGLILLSGERIDGTVSEREFARSSVARAYRDSPEYEDLTVMSILQVLQADTPINI